MDSLNYGLIAEKLGISLKNLPQSTAAIIVDGQVFEEISKNKLLFISIPLLFQDESSYVLKDTLSTTNLIDFVYNYTTNKVSRHLRHDQNIKHSHFYRSVNSQNDQNYHFNAEQRKSNRKFESIAIPTISSENFTNFLSEPHKVSIDLNHLKRSISTHI